MIECIGLNTICITYKHNIYNKNVKIDKIHVVYSCVKTINATFFTSGYIYAREIKQKKLTKP